jgi:hypothetical protein
MSEVKEILKMAAVKGLGVKPAVKAFLMGKEPFA